jgi:hypothetical protein
MTDVQHEVTPVQTPTHDESDHEWTSPVIDEQSACAEICAYVFTA